ncbi:MAG: T9SS type A sorting domain-containing protein [Saprospiraceae bacterium]
MKRFIWLIMIMMIPFFSLAQLTVDAGTDTTFCVTAQGQVLNGIIGGDPTVSGGTAPYTYTWEIEYYIGSYLFTASYFLNDTTIANPMVIFDAPEPSITFHVTVTDANGNQGTDSISISFSKFGILPVINDVFITSGDTTPISISVGGGTPPYTYEWFPNYKISDTTVASPLVWSESDTFYMCTIKDALGCPFTFNNIVIVTVWPVSTKQALIKDLKIYPNPTQDYLMIELEKGEIQHINITDMLGKVVLQQSEVLNNQIDISTLRHKFK